MRTTHRLLTMAVALTGLVAVSIGSASAGGFDEFTVEEIGENTATCDFDGDGEYTDYWVTPQQTVLQKTTMQVDGQGVMHAVIITVFDGVEYRADGATPPVFYNTGRSIFNVTVEDDTLLTATMRSFGMAIDAEGALLYQGPGNFDLDIIDGEIVGFTARGPVGPCVPGV